ncbi:UMP kinase [Candidatus Woesearchaeota archaeon]|nr:UMP kinase [Candidatus Woesearchaeota archaeon]
MKNTIILSLGGSVIVPDKIDVDFLKNFKKLVIEFVEKGYKFVIICGGGSTARKYQKAYEDAHGEDEEVMDWIGISATHINAFLLRTLFYEISEEKIINDPTEKIKFKKKILFAGGWKPGWSTDYDAVLLAKNLGISEVINMTNIDCVYDGNPKKFKDAKPIREISWKEFQKLVGDKWKAGSNFPFDPIAAKEAEKLKLKVVVLGKSLSNLKNLLNNKEFKGTIIK